MSAPLMARVGSSVRRTARSQAFPLGSVLFVLALAVPGQNCHSYSESAADSDLSRVAADGAATPIAASSDQTPAKDAVVPRKEVTLPPELAHIAFAGGDGSSCEKAVVIERAKNTAEGLAAEKIWLSTYYPQATIMVKAQHGQDKRFFETVEFRTKDASTMRICFDITGFFGTR